MAGGERQQSTKGDGDGRASRTARDHDGGTGANSSTVRSASAARRTAEKDTPDRSAMSTSEWRPSEKLSTQKIASFSSFWAMYPPSLSYKPRRPSCGSPN